MIATIYLKKMSIQLIIFFSEYVDEKKTSQCVEVNDNDLFP